MIDPNTLHPTELHKINKTGQISTILIAAFEYFITLLVSGTFLASILTKIGVPDSVAGITSSLASLGFVAQFFAMFLAKANKSAKRIVTPIHFIAELMFMLLYIVPFIRFPQGVKTALFMVLYLCGAFLQRLITPLFTNWQMGYVNKRQRGSFTATKEIVSLIGGMIFSWVMGALIDHFDAIGQSDTGFILCGATIFTLSVLLLVCYLPIKELQTAEEAQQHISIRETIKGTLGNKNFRKIIYLDIFWHVGQGLTHPFLGTYINNELGFSLTLAATITMVGSFTRALVSKPMGRFADKTSWAKALMICFIFGAAAYGATMLANPATGLVMYTAYMLLQSLYMSGTNSGITNIVFDYAQPHLRTGALGIKASLGGLSSFLATLVGARIVDAMQANGNQIFGMTIYAQQILSALTCLIFIFTIFYIKFVIMKLRRVEE